MRIMWITIVTVITFTIVIRRVGLGGWVRTVWNRRRESRRIIGGIVGIRGWVIDYIGHGLGAGSCCIFLFLLFFFLLCFLCFWEDHEVGFLVDFLGLFQYF